MRKRISSQPQRESPSANTAWLDLEALALLRALSAESPCSRAAKLGDCLSARWLMKVHHSLARYHGGAADMNKRCAMWLPTFLQRGIHFFGERTEVLAFNNLILFDRIHLPIIGKRAPVVEEKAALLSQSAVTLRRVALSALLTNYQSSIPSDPSSPHIFFS